MQTYDYIIVGGGLSGLSCARTIQNQGKSFIVLESGDSVGGRVRSKNLDGFVIDEGFQVLLDSYPELSNLIELENLNLQKFNSGALIFDGKEFRCLANPLVHPDQVANALFQDFIPFKDKALTMKLIFQARSLKDEAPLSGVSTRQFLIDFGFSESFIKTFWEPFLTGVFLDPQLGIDSNFFKFLIAFFSNGRVSVPMLGMQELPKLIGQSLKAENIRLKQSVSSYDKEGVQLASGERILGQQVIVACDMNPANNGEEYYSVSTFYFTGSDLLKLNWDKWLVLIPRHLGFNIDHACLLSHVSSAYAPSGSPLLSVSVVGNKIVSPDTVINDLKNILQTSLNLKHLDTIHVRRALPKVTFQPAGFEIKNDIVYCGDRFVSASINGALKSGRLAAEYCLKRDFNA